jgi:iron complex transport system permease protein
MTKKGKRRRSVPRRGRKPKRKKKDKKRAGDVSSNGNGNGFNGLLHKRTKRVMANLMLLGFLFVSIFMAAMFGSIGPLGPGYPEYMPPEAVFDILIGRGEGWSDLYNVVVIEVRLPRIVLSALVGCALGVAGATMQALFRNPMAEPYILGLSSGAALGAGVTLSIPVTIMTFTVIGVTLFVSSTSLLLPFLTFTGALGTIALVYNIARMGGKVHTDTLLLSGIAVSAFFGAIVMAMLFFAGHQFKSLFFWMLGGFGASTWTHVVIVAPVVISCIVVTLFYGRDLNLLLLGEDAARNLGMRVEKVKGQLLIISSLLAGISVAFAGIIGFVGLIIPHMIRLVVGPDHRALVPASAITGAIFMIWMDTAARTMMGFIYGTASEIPVGILTALCGGPFFLYLLRTSRRKGRWTGG